MVALVCGLVGAVAPFLVALDNDFVRVSVTTHFRCLEAKTAMVT